MMAPAQAVAAAPLAVGEDADRGEAAVAGRLTRVDPPAGARVPQLHLVLADEKGIALMVDDVVAEPMVRDLLGAPFGPPLRHRVGIVALDELRAEGGEAAGRERLM